MQRLYLKRRRWISVEDTGGRHLWLPLLVSDDPASVDCVVVIEGRGLDLEIPELRRLRHHVNDVLWGEGGAGLGGLRVGRGSLDLKIWKPYTGPAAELLI